MNSSTSVWESFFLWRGRWYWCRKQIALMSLRNLSLSLRVLSLLGAVISVLGFGFGVYLLIGRLIYGPDWAAGGVFTLFAILFIFIGAQFIGMGLLGEYVGRVYQDVRARPRYFVERVVGRRASPATDAEASDRALKGSGLQR